MQIDMPATLTRQNKDAFHLPGGLSLVSRDVDAFYYAWELNETSASVTLDFIQRVVILSDLASPAQKAALQAALAAFRQPPAWDAVARQILQLAQSGVGVDVRQLSDNQRWALLAVLLWDRRAIGDDLKVRPLREWVRRRRD